jgi:hypothetical protein
VSDAKIRGYTLVRGGVVVRGVVAGHGVGDLNKEACKKWVEYSAEQAHIPTSLRQNCATVKSIRFPGKMA